jgi:hypothetical protein
LFLKPLPNQAITNKQAVPNNLLMQTKYLQLHNQKMDKMLSIIVAHFGIHFVDSTADNRHMLEEHEDPPPANPTR